MIATSDAPQPLSGSVGGSPTPAVDESSLRCGGSSREVQPGLACGDASDETCAEPLSAPASTSSAPELLPRSSSLPASSSEAPPPQTRDAPPADAQPAATPLPSRRRRAATRPPSLSASATALEWALTVAALLCAALLLWLHASFVARAPCAAALDALVSARPVPHVLELRVWVPPEATDRPVGAAGEPREEQRAAAGGVSALRRGLCAAAAWLPQGLRCGGSGGGDGEDAARERLLRVPPGADVVASYVLSQERGFIVLSEAARRRHGVVHAVRGLRADAECLASTAALPSGWPRTAPARVGELLSAVSGWDALVVNSLAATAWRGYVVSARTSEVFTLLPPDPPAAPGPPSDGAAATWTAPQPLLQALDWAAGKASIAASSLFVVTATTAAASYALRETQRRMLKLTIQFQLAARNRRTSRRLFLTHLSESLTTICMLVGLLFFLAAFFHDQLFCLAVLSLAWCSELLSVASAAPRAPVSVVFAPRFAAVHLTALCIYVFSFPAGFPYVALAACALSSVAWALFFRNRFDVPQHRAGSAWDSTGGLGGLWVSVRLVARPLVMTELLLGGAGGLLLGT